MVRAYGTLSEEEIKLLTKLKNKGLTYKEITQQLPGRSIYGVKNKTERLGLCKTTGARLILQKFGMEGK